MTAGPAVGELILVDEELRIGSSADGDGALGGDGLLSREHTLLTRDHAGEWMVRDLGSETGTHLNGQPLFALESLHRGDVLRVGESRLLVVAGPAPRPPGKRVSSTPAIETSVLSLPAEPEPPLAPPAPTAEAEPVNPLLEREPVVELERRSPRPAEPAPSGPVVPGL